MSDEEIKAIEELKDIIEEVKENTKQEIPTYIFDRDIKCLPIVLNLITKQQKEIKIQEDMIDEMVCELSTEGYLDDVCQMKQDNDECDDCCNLCIKEYFRKKLERK